MCAFVAIAIGIVLAGTAWCPRAVADSSGASSSTTLRVGWAGEPDNLNPFVGWENSSFQLWVLNYDLLFGFGSDGHPTLDLAAEYPTRANGGISADGRVWTIHLRRDVRWQDGKPLTAADVAFTVNYVIRNKMANMALATANIERARAVDATTVQIICSRPKADLEYIFLPILPRHVWSKVDLQQAQGSFANGPPIVGSGPFQVTEWKRGSFVRLERNPLFWGSAPAVDEIIYVTYQSSEAMVSDLKAGVIDAAVGLPQAYYDQLRAVPGITVNTARSLEWDYLDLNCSTAVGSTGNPVLRDRRFRFALNYAVDRNELCRIAFFSRATPAYSILPPGVWSDPDYHWEPSAGKACGFDLGMAGRLLDEAGYPRGSDGVRRWHGKPITLRLWARSDNASTQTMGRLIAGWFSRLGLKIEFDVLDYGAISERVWNRSGGQNAPDFDMYVDEWAGYRDPGQTLVAETTRQIGSTNEPYWSDAAYDRLCDRQAAAVDPVKRRRLIWRMQRIMYRESPWIVLTYPDQLEAYASERWRGWARSGLGQGSALTGRDSFLALRPGPADRGVGRSSIAWVTVPTVAAAAAAIIIIIMRRRRALLEEEKEPVALRR